MKEVARFDNEYGEEFIIVASKGAIWLTGDETVCEDPSEALQEIKNVAPASLEVDNRRACGFMGEFLIIGDGFILSPQENDRIWAILDGIAEKAIGSLGDLHPYAKSIVNTPAVRLQVARHVANGIDIQVCENCARPGSGKMHFSSDGCISANGLRGRVSCRAASYPYSQCSPFNDALKPSLKFKAVKNPR